MYYKLECFTLSCDNCKTQYEDPDTGFSIFVDRGDAAEAATDNDWHIDDVAGKHYCGGCHSFDEEDNLLVKIL